VAFKERLRELREKAGLSQYALAALTGLSKQALSYLELGDREPGWDTVQRLALALGVDCRFFMDEGIVMPEPVPPGKPGRPRKAPAAGKSAREPSAAADAPTGKPAAGKGKSKGIRKRKGGNS